MSKVPQIKNRAPAPIQITAEQLLRESQERGLEDVAKPPKQFITDKEELTLYQQTKRKDFEDQIRRQRQSIGIWCRYALWEASQLEFERARSVFERSLDVDYRNQTLWFKYAEMEMKNKFINHARNIWDRAVTFLPRIDSFWYKYTYMEEMVGAIDNARQIFERWMAWEPDDLAWAAFIKFEMRQGDTIKARELYERYIALWPTSRAYLKYAKWEELQNEKSLARRVYERALNELHPHEKTEKLLVNFARFEERCKETDRARVIYQYAIANLSLEESGELKQEFLLFEKRHGDKTQIDVAVSKQRREYFETQLTQNPYNYDLWFDYARLEETEASETLNITETSEKSFTRIRSVLQRAINNKPPVLNEKSHWRRYIYLYIQLAIFEELTAKDMHRARAVYRDALNSIPHRNFTFGKIWLLAANFEIRQKNLLEARKILGNAIGICSNKKSLFRSYIELELQLGEVDRCRMIYAKYVASMPYETEAWQSFAMLEACVGESTRARAIFELGIAQPELDMPERLWRAFIDFELAEQEVEYARQLYERLLERSNHVKVWLSYAAFELQQNETDNTREVFQRGYDAMRKDGLKEERLMLLEAWRDMEQDFARTSTPSSDFLQQVESKFPRKVKVTDSMEGERYEYIFPDDEVKPAGMKLLEKAMLWKQMLAASSTSNTAAATAEGDDEGDKGEVSVLGKRRAEEELDIDA